jgi:hypothetical protein
MQQLLQENQLTKVSMTDHYIPVDAPPWIQV